MKDNTTATRTIYGTFGCLKASLYSSVMKKSNIGNTLRIMSKYGNTGVTYGDGDDDDGGVCCSEDTNIS